MFNDLVKKAIEKGEEAAAAITNMTSEIGKATVAAADQASDSFSSLSKKTYVPGMVRAAAVLSQSSVLPIGGPAYVILAEIGIKSKDDLLAVKWMVRDVDYALCEKLFTA